MKSTGIVRKVDELGRFVLPVELRRILDIHERESLEIFVENDQIILKKYNTLSSCIVTGKITHQNQTFCNGKIVLSPDGVKRLIEELEALTKVK